ncbi:hypothetical protein [Actinomadura macrotermitis]|uniref:Uncharacterized protein n=1 Tax=Actinomadura macrotermitis TaxID=2585200 RepID=A0A7K0BUJ5_9ACTN|nr:hypothetical protein [Actinomadura macrotermitis]MQY04807.1 hypothetical protein [Actinomadura macrotermitis]
MVRRSRLTLCGDVGPAGWVVAGVGPFGSGVGALVPHGFEAYARILHPAYAADGSPVTWARVAAWSGGVVHPRVQFQSLAGPVPRTGDARPWAQEPDSGSLDPALLAALCDVLARHTESAGRCWFCVWDGYGPASAGSTATFTADAGDAWEPDVLPPKITEGPRVELPERSYLLLEGPLDAAGELAMSLAPQSPSLFWPDDRAWCVTTETDLDSTYLGGTAALVAELLADERLEAVPVQVTDPVWADSDEINR